MTTSTTPPVRGRLTVLAGIVLFALSLRLAVASVSPVLGHVRTEIALDESATGVLGMLPTLGFAAMGLVAPALLRRLGLEQLVVLAAVATAAGELVRSRADTAAWFLGWSLLAMLGLGLGNVVLPPLIKKWFPDRLGALTSLYSMCFGISTAATPLLAVPLAQAAGWRFSIGVWASVSLVAVVPWLAVLLWLRPGRTAVTAATGPGAAPARPAGRLRPWRSPVSWGLVLVFTGTSSNTFAMFAWLPPYLTDQGLSAADAGHALFLYSVTGLPLSLVVPLVVVRMRNPFPLGLLFAGCAAAGYAGLLLAPREGTALWVLAASLVQGAYAMALLLINLRTRTEAGSAALSGLAQGAGYAFASAGPLGVGLLLALTGGWTGGFVLLWSLLAALAAGVVVAGRPRTLEDDVAGRLRGHGWG